MKSAAVPHPFSGWHFARQHLAQRYLKTLSSGVLLSTTIQAPTLTGLTNFLINDVMPQAAAEGFVTVYVDLSDPEVPVTAAVIAGLERVLVGSSAIQSGFNLFKGLFQSRNPEACSKSRYVKKIEVIDKNYFLVNREKNLQMIKSYFDKIIAYKSVLVLVDHAENLLKDDVAIEFCEYFRELITNHPQAIRPLYASSNPEAWSKVFQYKRSPLYSEGACVHNLPPLGKNYIRDACLRSGLSVSMDELVKCYQLTGHRPGIFAALLLGWDSRGKLPISSYFHQELFPYQPSMAVREVIPVKIIE